MQKRALYVLNAWPEIKLPASLLDAYIRERIPSFLQVYDMIMLERKTVRDISDEELSEDPLLFLSCGHAFPMSNLDGHLELVEHYARTSSGVWSATLGPRVRQQDGYDARKCVQRAHCRWQTPLSVAEISAIGRARMSCK